jgi:hypothetical protein
LARDKKDEARIFWLPGYCFADLEAAEAFRAVAGSIGGRTEGNSSRE